MKEKKIALNRIKILYNKAVSLYDKNPELSRKYIYIILKIKNKFRIRFGSDLKNKFCKKCYTVWIPGKTLSIRIRKGRIIYQCKYCKYVKRFKIKKPYKGF